MLGLVLRRAARWGTDRLAMAGLAMGKGMDIPLHFCPFGRYHLGKLLLLT